jgi:high-affinity nickel-transport protein
MEPHGFAALLITTLLLGLAHGIDWDHIAAITDITGTVDEWRPGLYLATLYALGHALVVVLLGVAAILAGLALPEWVDDIMGPAVGVTLIFLAVWIVYSLFHHHHEFKLRSRWMLVFDAVGSAVTWTKHRLAGNPQPFVLKRTAVYGGRAAFGIGMLHGIGAETATQALLFLAVAGMGGKLLGTLMLCTFVIGLVISNSLIAMATLSGFRLASRNRAALRVVGGCVALFSLVVGIVFITGHESALPKIIEWSPSL